MRPPSRVILASRTTNHELDHLCRKFGIPLNAIVSKDQLSTIVPKPGAYIINMQDSDEGHGTHWVGLALKKDRTSWYFDSFGIGPPSDVVDFCGRFGSKDITISDKTIQNIDGGGCGSYVVDFLANMFLPAMRSNSSKQLFNYFLNKFN